MEYQLINISTLKVVKSFDCNYDGYKYAVKNGLDLATHAVVIDGESYQKHKDFDSKFVPTDGLGVFSLAQLAQANQYRNHVSIDGRSYMIMFSGSPQQEAFVEEVASA